MKIRRTTRSTRWGVPPGAFLAGRLSHGGRTFIPSAADRDLRQCDSDLMEWAIPHAITPAIDFPIPQRDCRYGREAVPGRLALLAQSSSR